MSPSSQPQELLTLEEVKDRFEDWRGSRDRTGKIPDDLRSDAASLVGRYYNPDILRDLRLNSAQLKRFLIDKQKPITPPTASPTLSFLEIPLPSVPVVSFSPCSIELQNSKGLTLRLQNCTKEQFSTLLQTFIQSS